MELIRGKQHRSHSELVNSLSPRPAVMTRFLFRLPVLDLIFFRCSVLAFKQLYYRDSRNGSSLPSQRSTLCVGLSNARHIARAYGDFVFLIYPLDELSEGSLWVCSSTSRTVPAFSQQSMKGRPMADV
jgi:hypothetical protein